MQEDNNMKIVECNRNAKPGEIITFALTRRRRTVRTERR